MITKIEVDGFKSLKNFELKLHEGLNILVGPNGSGKTNIVLFFEFLSKLVTMPVGDALTQMGGFGFIFQKTESGYVDSIKVKIIGERRSENIDENYTYSHSFELKTSDDSESVTYVNQKLIIIDKIQTITFKNPHGKFHIENSVQPHEGLSLGDSERIKSQSEGLEGLSKYFIELGTDISQDSLIRIYSPFLSDYFPTLLTDLKGGETLNIVPKRIREQESAISLKGIQSDGYGLAKTLFEMQRGNGNNSNYNARNFQKAIAYLKLANTAIHDLVIEKDDFDNKLVPKVYIKSSEKASILPMAFLSDGTLKWLTLVTAVLTSDHLFCIEEPENYLHPWMQAEMCTLMREHLEMKNEPSFILMTTHSETLLNAAKPEEVIVVSMKNGETRAQRVENPELLREIISDSGFGLGHLYLTNSLSD
jgi:predicted ATPase